MKASALLVLLALLICGCSSRGEGLTINSDGLHVGTSLAKRDQIAQGKANAEIAQILARTKLEIDRMTASIERAAEMGKVTRPVVLALGIALAISLLALGIGYGSQATAPLAAEGVKALQVQLDIRKARRLEVVLQIGPGGYVVNLTAVGYEPAEIARIVQSAPALNAPRLAELQGRIGPHGMQALVDAGELENTLALLPDKAQYEEVSHAQ